MSLTVEFHLLDRESNKARIRYTKLVSWSPSSNNWLKLNTDGSNIDNLSLSAVGGLIRNRDGVRQAGFSLNLGYGNIMLAELNAIRHGLSLAWNMGYRLLHIESDSKEAVSSIHYADVGTHPMGSLILDYRFLMSREWSCTLTHCYRKTNFSADHLAKLGQTLSIGLHI
ncbi:Ribonuclease H protein [Quillaja saponaria]|uniref:Ribonuclease H protein n=1 Tax=Quillaja saponaria TaxID=32244 RepID=A0AAD7L3U1_QUISA|nr:Ribonuclease H protein [Quillaja saponaria]